MPVIDSIAPITPSTPSDNVAIRGPNSAVSSCWYRVWMKTGRPASSRCSVLLMAGPSCCGSRPDRTTNQVEPEGDCRMGRNIAGAGFSVLCNTHHLYARSIRHLVITAHCVGYRAENFTCKLPIYYRYAWRVLVVMPGEGPARQQGRPRSVEVFGRDLKHDGISGGVRWPQI